jgi:uncharacterized protein
VTRPAGHLFEGMTPEIDYPCRWPYKVIGRDEQLMRRAVAAVVGSLEHSLELSNVSRAGRYRSLLLTVAVASDEERRRIGQALHAHCDVHMVF